MKIGSFTAIVSVSSARGRGELRRLRGCLVQADHLFERHSIEQPGDAGLDRPDRLPNGASPQLWTAQAGVAPYDPERPLDGPQDLADLDLARVSREDISTLRTVEALDQLLLGEPLEDLRHELGRHVEILGDALGVDWSVMLMEGNVVDRHQPVVNPLAEPQHRCLRSPTGMVGYEIDTGPGSCQVGIQRP